MLIPAEVWDNPENDAIYRGFDANLIYVAEEVDPNLNYVIGQGFGGSSGVVDITTDSIRLTALPNSQPTVHLVTTPLNRVDIALNVRVLESNPGTMPLRIGIWTPRGNHGYFLKFGPSPDNEVVAESMRGGRVVNAEILGTYSPTVAYRLDMSLDKDAGVISVHLTNAFDSPPRGSSVLRITGKTSPELFSRIYSTYVPVVAGKDYSFGGTVKLLSGSNPYGFVVSWLDGDGRRLVLSEEWRHVGALVGWNVREYSSTAPAGAVFAELEIATDSGTDMLFTNVFLRDAENPGANLIENGDFSQGGEGWRRGSVEQEPLAVFDLTTVNYESAISSRDLPDLFGELRLSISAIASSDGEDSTVILDDYSLTLPHQRWLAARIDDTLANALVIALLVAAGMLVVVRFVRWGLPVSYSWPASSKTSLLVKYYGLALTNRVSPGIIFLLIGAFVYVLLNSLLFNAGSLNYDLLSGSVWEYTLVKYGPSQLYHLPVVTPVAEAWEGLPIQEAAFPYEPVMAYIYMAGGWIYKLIFAQPGAFTRDAFQLAFVIKTFSALFTFGSAVLIYLILREQQVERRWCLISGGFLLLNPAVWFVGSVWGQTQSWSIFFLMAAIWLGEKKKPELAWLALAAVALTRQQMLVPAALLAIVFLRNFSVRQNVESVSWTIVFVFLVMAPFSLTIGPTLIVDLLVNAFGLHALAGNDQWTALVSWSALSIWPLVTFFVDGQSGMDRIFFSSRGTLFAGLTYAQVGTLLFLGLGLASAARLALRRADAANSYDYIPILALATLGLVMLRTEFAAFHMIPALTLVILSRRSMPSVDYCAAVAVLTITTFVSMYSIAGIWLANSPSLATGLFSPANPVNGFFQQFLPWNWFITLGSVANIFVLFLLASKLIPSTLMAVAVRGGRAKPPTSPEFGSKPVLVPARRWWEPPRHIPESTSTIGTRDELQNPE